MTAKFHLPHLISISLDAAPASIFVYGIVILCHIFYITSSSRNLCLLTSPTVLVSISLYLKYNPPRGKYTALKPVNIQEAARDYRT
jgi:hypothetical protein